jgi:type II secretory pathway component PulF
MKFAYDGYDKAGAQARGVVEASGEAEARDALRRKGVYVTSVREAGARDDAHAAAASVGRGPSGRSVKALAVFAREMAVLVSTGTPVVDALMAVERQTKDEKFRAVLHSVRRRVEQGEPLSMAMADHPQAFDAVSRSLVAAGESSGQMDEMLQRLAVLARRQAATRSTIIGALVYPALLLAVCVTVTTVMIAVVLPRFAGLFETLDTPLPMTTMLLMSVSDFLRTYWWGVVPAAIVGVVGGVLWSRSPMGRSAVAGAIIRTPQFGKLARSFATARIARLLGVLLDARVPMLESLALVRASMTNPAYRRLVEHAEAAVTRGDSVSRVLEKSDLVTPSVAEAVANGESTGRLAMVLLSVADYLDEENDTATKALSSLLEPIIMITLGLVVGFVAISMFLPLFDLTAAAGGGSA